jgi:hypothetical protein
MTPTERIAEWLQHQVPEVRATIAFVVLGFQGDATSAMSPDALQELLSWIDTKERGKTVTLGRALTFRAVVEYSCGLKFSADGWTEAEGFYDRILADAEAGDAEAQRFSQETERTLHGIPFRAAQWARAGKSWRTLVDEHLSDEMLRQWELKNLTTDAPDADA